MREIIGDGIDDKKVKGLFRETLAVVCGHMWSMHA
jgi:hypothetical protein